MVGRLTNPTDHIYNWLIHTLTNFMTENYYFSWKKFHIWVTGVIFKLLQLAIYIMWINCRSLYFLGMSRILHFDYLKTTFHTFVSSQSNLIRFSLNNLLYMFYWANLFALLWVACANTIFRGDSSLEGGRFPGTPGNLKGGGQ